MRGWKRVFAFIARSAVAGAAAGAVLAAGASRVGLLELWGFGLAMGAAQWLLLRGRLPDASRWLVASLVGAIAGAALVVLSIFAVWGIGETPAVLAGYFGTMGVGVGAAQWAVLDRHAARMGWWVPCQAACAAAYALARAGYGAVQLLAAGQQPRWHAVNALLDASGVAGGAASGALYGALSGAALAWLLRRGFPGAA